MSRHPSVHGAASEVRDLRGDIRHWRRGRADTRLLEALGDAYTAVFAALVLGSMVVSVLVNLRLVSDEACTASGCQDARALLPWLVVLGVLALVLSVARLFGPVFVSPAVASWLMGAPVDRSALLRPRLLWTGGVAAVVSLLVTAAATTLGGFTTAALLAVTASSGLLALAAVGGAAVSQAGAGHLSRALTWALTALLWLGLLGLALGLTVAPPAPTRVGPLGAALMAGLLLLAGVALLAAVARLPRLARHQVAPGGSLAPGLSGALATLDLALAYDVVIGHRWNGHLPVRSRRGGPSGRAALVWCDAVRVSRSPRLVVVPAAAVVVAYAAEAAGAGRVVLLLAALAGFLTGLPLLSALRVMTRTPSLVRAMPFPVPLTRRSTLAVPGGVLLLCGLATAPALAAATAKDLADGVLLGGAVGLAVLASGVRWVTGRPPDYAKPLVSTPAGAVPTNLYGSVLRGFDVLLVAVTPVLFAPTPGGVVVSAGFSLAVLSYLTSRA